MNTLLPDARASRTASAAASAMHWPTTSQLRPAPPLWPVTPKGAILECASAARALPKLAVAVRIHDRLKRSFSSRLHHLKPPSIKLAEPQPSTSLPAPKSPFHVGWCSFKWPLMFWVFWSLRLRECEQHVEFSHPNMLKPGYLPRKHTHIPMRT